MRIENRPHAHDSQKGIAIVLAFAFITFCICTLIRVTLTPEEELNYGMHPEPIVIFDETVEMEEIFVEEVVFEQESKLSDTDILANLCMGEAGCEPLVGKVAVVVTVLNRANLWDKTIYEVVTEKNQYAGYPYVGTIDAECYLAVEIAREAVEYGVFPEDMLYFRTKHYHTFGEPYTVIGDHYFSCVGKENE